MEEVPRPRTKTPPRTSKVPKPEPEATKTGTTGTPDSSRSPAAARPSRDDVKLRESVKGMYEGVAMLAFAVGMQREHTGLLQFSGTLMEPSVVGLTDTGDPIVVDPRTGADKIADAWMTAADRNPRIKQALKRVTEGGALAEVAALHMTLLLPFLPGIPGLAFLAPHQHPAGSNGTGT